MKKSVSVAYTVFVVVILLGVIAYFGWDAYQSRAARITDFEARTGEYTRRLTESITEKRDVAAEVEIAEKLMAGDPSLVAIQVYSHDDGLRLSVVQSVAGEFARAPIAESDRFAGWIASLRYHVVTRPVAVPEMQGMEALYVSATLSGAEIRNSLLIVLITVVGLFVITLFLILVRPGGTYNEEDGVGSHYDEYEPTDPGVEAFSSAEEEDFSFDSHDDAEFDIPDLPDSGSLDENDLRGSGMDFSESLSMDDDFDLPDLDDFPMEPSGGTESSGSEMMERLGSELERAASFNQDLSLVLFTPGGATRSRIKDAYDYADLVFGLDDGSIAVIEINKDLDGSLAHTEEFVRNIIDTVGNRKTRAGIASRNGRLISAERLYAEALGALRRTDGEKNIVAFRSDPEKYREYLRSQAN